MLILIHNNDVKFSDESSLLSRVLIKKLGVSRQTYTLLAFSYLFSISLFKF